MLPARHRRWVLLAYWTLMFALTHWPGLDDLVTVPQWIPHADKYVHFGMYAGWMVTWWWVLAGRRWPVNRQAFTWALAGGAAYAIFDELTQIIVSRDCEVGDWLADVGGMTTAMLMLMSWQQFRARQVS